MLKLGAQSLSALYLGGEKITKAYQGDALVFGEEKPSRLPAGYTEVEYLTVLKAADGVYNSCLLNAYNNNINYRFELDLEFITAPTGTYIWKFFNTNNSTGSVRRFNFSVAATSINCYLAASSSLQTKLSGITIIGKHTFKVDWKNNKLYWDSTTDSLLSVAPTANLLTNNQLKLLANVSGSYRVRSFRLYNNNSLEQEYVPCKNPSGEAGFYCPITKKFIAGVTTYIQAGPAV